MTQPLAATERRRRYNGRRKLPQPIERELDVLQLLARVQVAPQSSITALDLAHTLGWVEELMCPVTAATRVRTVLLRLEKRELVARGYPHGRGRGGGKRCVWRVLPGWRQGVDALRGELQQARRDAAGGQEKEAVSEWT